MPLTFEQRQAIARKAVATRRANLAAEGHAPKKKATAPKQKTTAPASAPIAPSSAPLASKLEDLLATLAAKVEAQRIRLARSYGH